MSMDDFFPQPIANIPPLRVLVVDDQRDEADPMAQLLTFRGYSVKVAYGSREALRVATEFRPDVLVCDLGLPEMNGYELAKQLKEHLPEAVLIATTGHIDGAYSLQAREAGFHHFFTKPVSLAKLRQVLESVGERRPAP